MAERGLVKWGVKLIMAESHRYIFTICNITAIYEVDLQLPDHDWPVIASSVGERHVLCFNPLPRNHEH